MCSPVETSRQPPTQLQGCPSDSSRSPPNSSKRLNKKDNGIEAGLYTCQQPLRSEPRRSVSSLKSTKSSRCWQ